MLEISGTFLGAIHSVLLHRKVQDSSDSLQTMLQRKADLKIILKFYAQKLKEEAEAGRREEAEGRRRKEPEARRKDETKARRREAAEEARVQRRTEESALTKREGMDRQYLEEIPMEDALEEESDETELSEDENTIPSYSQSQPPLRHPTSQIINTTSGTFINGNGNVINIENTHQIPTEDDVEDRRERLQTLTDFIQDAYQRDWYSQRKGKVLRLIEAILDEVWKRTPKHGVSSPPSPSSMSNHVPPTHIARVPTEPDRHQHQGHFAMVIRPIMTYGNIPLASMACGVVCLAVATILLSLTAKELRKETWIGLVGVLIVVMGLSVLPLRFVIDYSFDSRNTERPFFSGVQMWQQRGKPDRRIHAIENRVPANV
jgi:hypothetical protein